MHLFVTGFTTSTSVIYTMEDPYLNVVDHEEIIEQDYTFSGSIAQKLSGYKRTIKKAKLSKDDSSTDLNSQQHGSFIAESSIDSLQVILDKDPSLDKVTESLLKESVAEGTFKSYSVIDYKRL